MTHQDALPALTDPALTVVVGELEHRLKGELSLGDFRSGSAPGGGLILSPEAGSSFIATDGALLLLDSSDDVSVRVNARPVEVETTRNEEGLLTVQFELERGRNLVSVSSGLASESLVLYGAGEPVELSFEPVRLVADGRSTLLVDVVACKQARVGTAPSALVPIPSSWARTPLLR